MTKQVIRFYVVGLIGAVVQLSALAWLTRTLGMNHLLSTALAVEIAILHNFMWHDRWTWPGRPAPQRLRRLCTFNISTGLISMGANVCVTGILVDSTGLAPVPANAIAIAAASVATYVTADLIVFRVRSAVT
jgi:putative flippase GtrA